MSPEFACREKLQNICVPRGDKSDCTAHAGLVLATCLKDQESKRHVFHEARQAVRSAYSVYRPAFERWKSSLGAAGPWPEGKVFYVQGRMAIGLGTESVLEIGLTLHHTYGTPLIPGSALKGLAAHYCDQVWGQEDQGFKAPPAPTKKAGSSQERETTYFEVIFGNQKNAGHIIFHDAWITPETLDRALHADVMTPHHSDYYTARAKIPPPSDFDKPKPISFLSISGAFHVAICCDIVGEEGRKWAGLTLELLRQALENWGIGAKTNAGYGRMTSSETQPEAQPPPWHSEKDRVEVIRVEDNKKGRPSFRADDNNE